jgi:hypothetical protein
MRARCRATFRCRLTLKDYIMITLMTEDGYKFYLLDDGRIVDSLDEDTRDITFESFEEFVRLTQE